MMIKTFALFVATALAEITGCYLPWLWLRKGGSVGLLVPACLSLAVFAWLLTLHPAASGRVYAAYGCVYVVTALLWLRLVDGVPLASTDILGGAVALVGMGHYCLRLGNRCIKARAIRHQCKSRVSNPAFALVAAVLFWKHGGTFPTREMPPCVRMHAYMLSPVLMR
jgi:Uncharacterized conserved protein